MCDVGTFCMHVPVLYNGEYLTFHTYNGTCLDRINSVLERLTRNKIERALEVSKKTGTQFSNFSSPTKTVRSAPVPQNSRL